jgi:hypothetical protein
MGIFKGEKNLTEHISLCILGARSMEPISGAILVFHWHGLLGRWQRKRATATKAAGKDNVHNE